MDRTVPDLLGARLSTPTHACLAVYAQGPSGGASWLAAQGTGVPAVGRTGP